MRKLAIAFLLILGCAGMLLGKIKTEDQAFFDGKFQELADQQAKLLKAQQEVFNAQLKQLADAQKAHSDALSDLAKSQSRLQTTIEELQHLISQLEVTISNLSTNNTQDTQYLKQEIEQLRAQVQEITGGAAGTPAVRKVVGYITAVSPDSTVTVNLGSGNGLRAGSQLGLYKASDSNTRVGTLEVTDVVDQGNAHAKIKILNAGVTPEDSDVVKPD